MPLNNGPCFHGGPNILYKHSWLQCSILPPPQAISMQLTVILSLSLFSKPHIPAPSPCSYQWAHVSGQACRAVAQTLCIALTLSCRPQIGFCALPQASSKLPFCPSWSSHGGDLPGYESLLSASALSSAAGPISSSFFSFILPSNIEVPLVLLVSEVFCQHSVGIL